MGKRYILSIDQGTTSTRCILFNHQGEICGVAQKEHRQIFPQPGWVEHDPIEIWQNTQEVVLQAIHHSSLKADEIAAIGITNQRETAILWDKRTGQPLNNAIVWQDTRTNKICEDLSSKGGPNRFRKKTGLPVSTYFSATKILWLLKFGSEELKLAVRKGNALFGTVDSWLTWWLTGGPYGGIHVTDVTNASRTMLMNLETLNWDVDILQELSIPDSILPAIIPSSESSNNSLGRVSRLLGAPVPVCGILGDQQAALVGQACFKPGEVKNTYGTGCFILSNTGTKLIHSNFGLLTTVAYQFNNSPVVYALEGSIAVSGALVQWLRDNLGIIQSSDEIEILARSVKDNGDVFFVPAFSGLFAPHWRADARGTIVGLTRYSNKGHLARAALEATAFQTYEVVEAMRKDSSIPLRTLKVDGGMVKNELLMQFQADILEAEVVRPKISETSALGAAIAAGLSAGFWQNMAEIEQTWQEDRRWYPQMDQVKRDQLLGNWNKAVERSFGWLD
jgi:glycerol kinase